MTMFNITDDIIAQLKARKTFIIGRSASGKSTLEAELTKHGLVPLRSYTDRPKRSDDDNTHTFLTTLGLEMIQRDNKVIAETKINGYTYFATADQFAESDLYVIDPRGLFKVLRNYPNETFNLIYLKPRQEQYDKQIANRLATTSDTDDLMTQRLKDEDAQFGAFEETIKAGQLPKNINLIEVD